MITQSGLITSGLRFNRMSRDELKALIKNVPGLEQVLQNRIIHRIHIEEAESDLYELGHSETCENSLEELKQDIFLLDSKGGIISFMRKNYSFLDVSIKLILGRVLRKIGSTKADFRINLVKSESHIKSDYPFRTVSELLKEMNEDAQKVRYVITYSRHTRFAIVYRSSDGLSIPESIQSKIDVRSRGLKKEFAS